MKRIGIIGTVGVPANYGGFETLVENIIERKSSSDIQYIVYCSSKSYSSHLSSYKGAMLKYVRLNANGIQSIFYDIISLLKATKECDEILVLGVSGCCFLPLYRLFSRKKLIVNIDGLEHKRKKWSRSIRLFLKFSEYMAIKYGDVIIADNKGIKDYVREEYSINSELISYGGDHTLISVTDDEKQSILEEYNLVAKGYSFSVCRIEPENNVHIALQAFKENGQKLVFIGNWYKSEYGRTLLQEYQDVPNIILLSPIYDLKVLFVLRSFCKFYIHGHSAGGTNPSLVEAMFFKCPILAFDVVYNRATTENKAFYYQDAISLNNLITMAPSMQSQCAQNMEDIAYRLYCWRIITEQYEKLY